MVDVFILRPFGPPSGWCYIILFPPPNITILDIKLERCNICYIEKLNLNPEYYDKQNTIPIGAAVENVLQNLNLKPCSFSTRY